MNPRRQVTSLTLEDLAIMLQLALRAAPNHDGKLSCYLRVVVPADRRDADLMLLLISPCPGCGAVGARSFWSEQDGGSVWVRWTRCGNIATKLKP